jgi:hypothetical protein
MSLKSINMKSYKKYTQNTVIIGIFFLFQFSKCSQTSAPGFLQARVELVPLNSNAPLESFDITNAGASKINLPSNLAFHVLGSANGTPAVTSIVVSGNLTWRCYSFNSNHTKVVGVLNSVPINITTVNPVASSSSIDVSIKPLVQIAAVCGNIVSPGPTGGAMSISGDITITAINSVGTATSKTFVFEYADVPN